MAGKQCGGGGALPLFLVENLFVLKKDIFLKKKEKIRFFFSSLKPEFKAA